MLCVKLRKSIHFQIITVSGRSVLTQYCLRLMVSRVLPPSSKHFIWSHVMNYFPALMKSIIYIKIRKTPRPICFPSLGTWKWPWWQPIRKWRGERRCSYSIFGDFPRWLTCFMAGPGPFWISVISRRHVRSAFLHVDGYLSCFRKLCLRPLVLVTHLPYLSSVLFSSTPVSLTPWIS